MSNAPDTTRGRGGKTGGVVALFFLLTSSLVCKVWLKRTSTKASEEGGLVTFSFNFPFLLEAIFYLPPLTCVFIKLIRVSMKESSILSFKGISKVGVLFFGHLRY
jgi:hypothetical protein